MSDTGLEQIVVLEDELDVVDGQVNEHTGDFRGLWPDQLSDKLIEDGTDLVLVVGVLRNDSWQNHVGSHDKLLVEGQRRLLLNLWLILNLVVHRLDVMQLMLRRWLLLLHHVWLPHASHLSTILVLTVPAVLVWSSVLRISRTSRTSLSHVSSWTTHMPLWLLLFHEHWHAFNQELEVVLKFFLVSKVSPLSAL